MICHPWRKRNQIRHARKDRSNSKSTTFRRIHKKLSQPFKTTMTEICHEFPPAANKHARNRRHKQTNSNMPPKIPKTFAFSPIFKALSNPRGCFERFRGMLLPSEFISVRILIWKVKGQMVQIGPFALTCTSSPFLSWQIWLSGMINSVPYLALSFGCYFRLRRRKTAQQVFCPRTIMSKNWWCTKLHSPPSIQTENEYISIIWLWKHAWDDELWLSSHV